MFTPKLLFVAVCLATCLWSQVVLGQQVRATTILFRHGQRTPIASLPNLSSDLTNYLGYGQLTNTGSRQLYNNGATLRQKYSGLFPNDGFFRLSNMQIMTSVPERTMMSLQSFMAGFFPPPVQDTTLPINWQPFYTTVDHAGRMIYFDMYNCPKFLNYLYQFIGSPPAQLAQWLAEDRAALDNLANLSGTPLPTLMEVIMLAEVLKAQIYIDPNTPEWAIDGYYDTLKKYLEASFPLYHGNFEMIKIRGGPLITEIINNMVAVASNDGTGKPILIYSAHDLTVSTLAYTLGVESQIPVLVHYGDTMMVDLVTSGNGEPNVKVVYMDNENTSSPVFYDINVPGCGTSCPLSTFRNALSGMMVTDWDALCAV